MSERLYGLLATFTTAEAVLAAAARAREAGYRRLEAFAPYPVEGLDEAVGAPDSHLPYWCLGGGLAGGVSAYLMQYYASVISYPINVGGRPHHSWPAFIPVTFELTILGAAVTVVVAMLALNGLPRPYHPVFAAPGFERASQDRFFLCIRADDPAFEPRHTRQFLDGLQPAAVAEVRP